MNSRRVMHLLAFALPHIAAARVIAETPMTSIRPVAAFLILLQPQFLDNPLLFRDLLHRESPVVFSTQIEAFLV